MTTRRAFSIGRSFVASRRLPRRGYTVTEFVVVVVVIAVVVGLLLPAVLSSKETARRMQCQNNLRRLAFGCWNHEQAIGHLPTGGWGVAWTGDADLGLGRSQPGGWLYNIMPFVESSPLHDMGSTLAPTQKNAAHLLRLGSPWPCYYCPTRRPPTAYPWTNSWSIVNAGLPTSVGRNDYAANGGDVYTSPGDPLPPLWKSAPPSEEAGPASLAEGGVNGSTTQAANAKKTFDAIDNAASGVIFCGSMVKLTQVTDGCSLTYLLGEKYINPDAYYNGADPGDDAAALVGDNENVARWTFLPPLRDTAGCAARWRFGMLIPTASRWPFATAR